MFSLYKLLVEEIFSKFETKIGREIWPAKIHELSMFHCSTKSNC